MLTSHLDKENLIVKDVGVFNFYDGILSRLILKPVEFHLNKKMLFDNNGAPYFYSTIKGIGKLQTKYKSSRSLNVIGKKDSKSDFITFEIFGVDAEAIKKDRDVQIEELLCRRGKPADEKVAKVFERELWEVENIYTFSQIQFDEDGEKPTDRWKIELFFSDIFFNEEIIPIFKSDDVGGCEFTVCLLDVYKPEKASKPDFFFKSDKAALGSISQFSIEDKKKFLA